MPFIDAIPGRIFLIAALLPLAMAAYCLVFLASYRMHKFEYGKHLIIFGWIAVIVMATSAVLSMIGFYWLQMDLHHFHDMPKTMLARWSESVDFLQIGSQRNDHRPSLSIPLGYRVDRLTALMMCMVTVIGTLIFIFSIGYMKEELKQVHDHQAHIYRRGRFVRFFFYMLLFAFSMLHLLIADNLFQIFISWELVGVSSFLLIGFYGERKSAGSAATKAFIMNRIGDAGFLIGLAILFTQFGTFNLQELQTQLTSWDRGGLSESLATVMGLGLFAGCVGKSAQVPLQTWLPDAMEGPTPVSALIHAATMVAAGVYLCARCLPFFTNDVLMVVAVTGAITLLLSAATATVQNDIKRVLAFSTCSQLGYMMMALGLAGWTAGLFHLVTHAFFKALLFLGAGSVIYALHHEQDLRKMGGLRKKLPITSMTMLIGVMAIIGVPLFSGWYSKDLILAHSLHSPFFAAVAFGTVILTAYYITRLWLLAFAGAPRDHHVYDHAHESPAVMTVPLIVLAACAIGIAWGWPVWDANASLLGKELHHGEPDLRVIAKASEEAHHEHLLAEVLGLACGILGVLIAVTRFRTGKMISTKPTVVTKTLEERFYFDTIYDAVGTKPVLAAANALGTIDRSDKTASLDGALTNLGPLTDRLGRAMSAAQPGALRGYILALGLTVAGSLAILWVIVR